MLYQTQEFPQFFSGIFDISKRNTLAFLHESMNYPYRAVTKCVYEPNMHFINNPKLEKPFPQGARKRHS